MTDKISDVVFSPDGKLLVTASRDGTARVWDPKTGRLLRTLDSQAPLLGSAFSPDGRTIATMDTNGIDETSTPLVPGVLSSPWGEQPGGPSADGPGRPPAGGER